MKPYALLTVAVLVLNPGAYAAERNATARAEALLDSAEEHYWFGMEEEGNTDAFEDGKDLLETEDAKFLFSDLNETINQRRLVLLDDLNKQLEQSEDTLYGVLPLTRFVSESVFTDSLSLGTFETADDPAVMAATSAGLRLIEILNKGAGKYGQLEVFFVSQEGNHSHENELLYLFNKDPKFFVKNRETMVGIVGEEAWGKLYGEAGKAKSIDDLNFFFQNNKETLRSHFNNRYATLVFIEEFGDLKDKKKSITCSALIWDLGDEENDSGPAATFSANGFSRDRTHLYWPFVIGNLVLAVGTALFFRKGKNPTIAASAGLIAFLFGRGWPTAVGTAMTGLTPEATTLWYLAFWWPLSVFFIFLLGPMFLIKLTAEKFGGLVKDTPFAKPESLAPAVATGLAAALCSDLLLWGSTSDKTMNGQLAAMLVLVTTAVFFSQRLHAAGLKGGLKNAADAIALATLGMLLFAGGYFAYNLYATTGACIALGVALVRAKKTLPEDVEVEEEDAEEISKKDKHTPGELSQLALKPDFVEFENFKKIKNAFFEENEEPHLALIGAGGSGKSRIAEKLAREWKKEFRGLVRKGACRQIFQKSAKAPSYSMFRALFEDHFRKSPLDSTSQDGGTVADAAGDLFSKIIPVFGLARTAVSEVANKMPTISGEEEIERLVKDYLLHLAEKSTDKKVLLIIDDAQWIDKNSDEKLLSKLMQWKHDDIELRIIVISREGNEITKLAASSLHNLERISENKENTVKLLREGVKLTNKTAQLIVKMASGSSEGGWTWVLSIVQQLAAENKLTWKNEKPAAGFAFRNYKEAEDLPLPNGLADLVKKRLLAHPEHRELIRCTAMLGERFNAKTLAGVMQVNRLAILRELEKVEVDTGIIRDLKQEDDRFEMPSLKRKAVLELFGITREGPTSDKVPQIVRETHAVVADAFKESFQKIGAVASSTIKRIADHYYYAGKSQAKPAIEWNIRAARLSADLHQFEAARNRLSRAEAYATKSSEKRRILRERLLLDCREASATNNAEKAKAALTDCEQWLDEHRSASWEIRIRALQMRHEVAGNEKWVNNDAKKAKELWAENAKEAEKILNDFISKIENLDEQRRVQAETLQFLALALKEESPEDAKNHQRASLKLLQEDQGDEAHALRARIADSLARMLEGDEAVEYFKHSIDAKKRIKDAQGLAMSHGGRGLILEKQKKYEKARYDYQEAARNNKAIGSWNHACSALCGETRCHLQLKADDKAEICLDEAEKILKAGKVSKADGLEKLQAEIDTLRDAIKQASDSRDT